MEFKTKKVKMVNVSTRFTVVVDRTGLWKGKPMKSLLTSLKRTGGRNNAGRITANHRGGGLRRLYRQVDLKRLKDGIYATVERLEYDPIRTAFIALIKYDDGEYSYILAPRGLKPGMKVISGDSVEPSIGNCLKLKNIPDGTLLHNVELIERAGGKLARSAGSSVVLCGRELDHVIIQMPSGFKKSISSECRATVGLLSNPEHFNCVKGKAGKTRHLGRRPVVRGTAMNPVDHPHGGRGRGRKHMAKRGVKTVVKKNHF